MRITELLKPESIDLNAAPKDKNDTIRQAVALSFSPIHQIGR